MYLSLGLPTYVLFLAVTLFRFDNFRSDRADAHISLFMAPLAVLGLALPWAKLHDTVGTSPLVWQVQRLPGTCERLALSFTFMFLALLSLLGFGCGSADASRIFAVQA